MLGRVQEGGDALVRLNDAFLPDAVLVDVPAGMRRGRAHPRRALVRRDAPAGAPSSPAPCVRVGDGAAASVVEIYAGPAGAVADRWSCRSPSSRPRNGASLSYVVPADPGPRRLVAGPPGRPRAGGTPSLRTFTVGLGAAPTTGCGPTWPSRARARSEILSAYLGNGTQVHDIRTLQDHVAPRTTQRAAVPGGGGRDTPVRSTAA